MCKIEIINSKISSLYRALKAPFGGLGAVFFIFLMNGCKEVGPVVPWGASHILSDTTYVESPQTPQSKYVLIEDVTGVSCPNCPPAHVLLDTLISDYNVIGVSYHVGSPAFNQDAPIIANPLQVLTSTDAQKIATGFSYPGAGPIAMIDRVPFQNGSAYPGNNIWNLDPGWGGDVTSELTTSTAPVNIYLTCTYTSGSSRQIGINVALHYTVNQTDSDLLSVFLTEDSVITAQLLPSGAVDTFYRHDHIMRAAVSNALGDVINAPSFAAGRVVVLNYNYTIPTTDTQWNPAHMNVVAFVHRYQHGANSVLQAQLVQLFPHH